VNNDEDERTGPQRRGPSPERAQWSRGVGLSGTGAVPCGVAGRPPRRPSRRR
jgi:hypothetical protein